MMLHTSACGRGWALSRKLGDHRFGASVRRTRSGQRIFPCFRPSPENRDISPFSNLPAVQLITWSAKTWKFQQAHRLPAFPVSSACCFSNSTPNQGFICTWPGGRAKWTVIAKIGKFPHFKNPRIALRSTNPTPLCPLYLCYPGFHPTFRCGTAFVSKTFHKSGS